MALRTIISERQRRIGAELRQLREQCSLPAGEAGAAIGMGASHLSHVEAGRTAITSDRLRALCSTYGVSNEPYVDALVGMSESSGKGWWTEYRKKQPLSALNLAELEASARHVQSHESLFIPGLFQTEQYMRATFANVQPELSGPTIDDSAAFRSLRQRLLTGEAAPSVHAVIHEAALHMRIGGPEIMREQLLHLVELSRLPNVVIQVFPFQAGIYAAFSGSFLLATPSVPELSTVLLDHPVGPLYIDDAAHLAEYRAMFDRLTEAALAPINPNTAPETHTGKDSLGLIQHILYTL